LTTVSIWVHKQKENYKKLTLLPI